MSNLYHSSILMLAMGVSALGVLIVLTLAFTPPTEIEDFLWRKPLIGSVFSLICVLGLSAAISPKRCSKTFHFKTEEQSFTSSGVSTTFKGHHPSCEKFSSHIIQMNSHTLCAACTGLLLGALTALVGTAFYFFGGWNIREISLSMVLIGVVGVILGFFQLKFRGVVRLMLNVFFVSGAFLVLAGIDQLTQSVFVDLFLVVLIVFWLLTRIMLSQWDHWRTCKRCSFSCKVREL